MSITEEAQDPHDVHETSSSEEREEAHHRAVSYTYRSYRRHCLSANHRRRKDFLKLPDWQQRLLPDYLDLLSDLDGAIIRNQALLNLVADSSDGFLFDSDLHDQGREEEKRDGSNGALAPDADYDKVKSTLRQLVRDWSQEGEEERKGCYAPVLQALEAATQHLTDAQKAEYNVLVPGAGLARLVWEVVRRGYSCQGNECSLYMLFMSNLILNGSTATHQHSIHPYLHTLSNVQSAADVLQAISLPDVLPADLPSSGGTMSMTAGDFVEVYTKEEEKHAFNAVVTCFFMDTANNVIEYLSAIRHCLKPDGLWINLGPLLWHHENSETEPSLELTLEDFKGLAGRMGFSIKDETMIPTKYTSSPHSMMRYEYTSAFFTARKTSPVRSCATE